MRNARDLVCDLYRVVFLVHFAIRHPLEGGAGGGGATLGGDLLFRVRRLPDDHLRRRLQKPL